MKTTLDYALEYIARGWSVLPLLPRSKQPAVKIANYLSGEWRMREEHARTWWGDNPDHGVAIVTGRPSGIVVLDVDPRNGGDASLVEAALPDYTPTVQTGGGGRHYFCAYPEGRAVACGKTGLPGVDRKGDGGYVVAAPSIHPSGEPYVWLHHGPLQALPDLALARTESQYEASSEPTQPWVAATLSAPASCRPGAQEGTLSRLCWWAARNLDQDIAHAILFAWLQQLPLGNPHDPWTEAHLAEKLDRAYEKRPADPGEAGPLVDDTPAPVAAFTPVTQLDFPDQEWVVEDFAAPGAFTEIIGKVKKGKSTLTYQLIDAVRRGADFLGRKTVQSGVVLLTEQTGTSLRKTLERAGLLDADNVLVLRKPQLKEIGGWERAVLAATQLALDHGYKIIIVDTLSRLAGIGGDRENESGVVSILDPFSRARDSGIACIFVRHARKGQSGEHDEIADAARGSSAITGDMDIVLRLTSHDDDTRLLSWESRITDDPEDVYLEYDGGTYQVIDKPAGKREQKTAEDMKLFRETVERVGTKYADLRDALGWGRGKIASYLKRLETFTHGPNVGPIEE